MEVRVRNVNDALPAVLGLLGERGVSTQSRNGPVTKFIGPVITIYERPVERVLFNTVRDANPFFHLFESLWMLAGRDDVKFVKQFVKRMATFSDDGKTLHGAYGKRWLDWFGEEGEQDQLLRVIEALKADPDDRRQVISMWDGHQDPYHALKGSKDVPCNTHIYVKIREGALDITLCVRSNDIIWGAYGANAVHMSYLQEFLAAGVGVPVGRMYQISDDLHAYHETMQPLLDAGIIPAGHGSNLYASHDIKTFPLVSTPIQQWREDLALFMDVGPTPGLRDPFFRRVAIPMWVAHQAYKQGDGLQRFEHAREALGNCKADDWKVAGLEWLQRREDKAKAH